MKIVYTLDSLHKSGGTERVLTTKMNWLAEHGCDVTIILIHNVDKPFFPLSPKVKVIDLAANSKKEYRRMLTEKLFEIKPDITISAGGPEMPIMYKIKDGSKKILEFHYTKNFLINFVKGLRNIRFRQLHLLKVWLLQKQLAYHTKFYDKLVGLTARDVGLWGNPHNMTFVHNPLSFRSEKKSTCMNKRIIAVGSFTPAKGMDQLIEAFGIIAHKHTDWELDLYGSGQDLNLLHELCARYDIDNQVSIHEPVPDIREKILESSIYAFPSRSDGFGLVITEAMECGLPTVAMDCPCGPREIITKDTGIIVPDQDIPAFANALEKLMTDDNLRTNMGHNAVKEVKRFYPDAIMPKWIEIFTQLTETK